MPSILSFTTFFTRGARPYIALGLVGPVLYGVHQMIYPTLHKKKENKADIDKEKSEIANSMEKVLTVQDREISDQDKINRLNMKNGGFIWRSHDWRDSWKEIDPVEKEKLIRASFP